MLIDEHFQNCSAMNKESFFRSKVKIVTPDTIQVIDPWNILSFSVNNEQSSLALYNNGITRQLPLSIDTLEERVKGFFRINPDQLINLEYLDNVSELENGYVIVANRYKYPIDHHHKSMLFDALSRLT